MKFKKEYYLKIIFPEIQPCGDQSIDIIFRFKLYKFCFNISTEIDEIVYNIRDYDGLCINKGYTTKIELIISIILNYY